MSISILSVLLLATQSPMTLGEALRLPPAEAGDRALAGLQHGPVVSVERVMNRYMAPPGEVELKMREAVQSTATGCVRHGWLVKFNHHHTLPENDAVLSSAYPQSEVMLNTSSDCPESGYAKVGANLPAPLALAALQTLDRVIAGKERRTIVCKNKTSTVLCENTKTTLRELAAIQPRLVTNQSGPVEIWLGTPGQIVTAVIFDKAPDGPLRVTREVPPPF